MIQKWRKVLLKIFLEDFEILPEERLLNLAGSIGTEIKFNDCTHPNAEIEFYDNQNNTIMNFLEKLQKEKRIQILKTWGKENNVEIELKQKAKNLTPIQKFVAKLFNIPLK